MVELVLCVVSTVLLRMRHIYIQQIGNNCVILLSECELNAVIVAFKTAIAQK